MELNYLNNLLIIPIFILLVIVVMLNTNKLYTLILSIIFLLLYFLKNIFKISFDYEFFNDLDIDVNNTNLDKDISIDNNYTSQNLEHEKALKNEKNIYYKSDDTIITDENIYSFDDFGYTSSHQLFIPTEYKTDKNDYGRNYIPPELWYRNNQRINLPVCVPSNGRCTIKDTATQGYPLDTIEWHSSRRVMNPDGINTDYIKQKLNSGN